MQNVSDLAQGNLGKKQSGQECAGQKCTGHTSQKRAEKGALTRYASSIAIAAALTFGLGVTMALMIKTRFSGAEKTEPQAFQIQPEIIDIEPPRRKVTPDIIRKVDVPPPSPRLDTAQKTKPSVPIIDIIGGAEMIWEPPLLLTDNPIVRIADQDEQPLYRAAPILPRRAERSGHCVMRFNVSAQGSPYDIAVQSCSETLFARAPSRP